MFKLYKKPALSVLSGALVAASMVAAPLAEARVPADTVSVIGADQEAVRPIPAQVTKGIQQLVSLLPELSKTRVVLHGEVDGPGVSGIAVSFLPASGQTEGDGEDQAIFDAQTGKLLVLSLQPQEEGLGAALTVEQAKARAASFVAGLQSGGNTYYTEEATNNEEGLTVRLVRKLNNVVLDDAYDVFVTFDKGGRLIGFRTFDGRLHEFISRADLPSAQRVISVEQAEVHFAGSAPLEKVYLLPMQASGEKAVEAKLVYLVKGGVVANSYTSGAVDAVTGGQVAAEIEKQQGQAEQGQQEQEQQPASREVVRTADIQGTGETWMANTEEQAVELVRELFQAEPGELPLHSFEEEWGEGRMVRYYVWGHFAEGVGETDLQYHLGEFPENTGGEQKKHLMLVTDGETGQLIRFVQIDETDSKFERDVERDRQAANRVLGRILPSGANQLSIREFADAEYTLIDADPIVNGIPVYTEGQTSEDAMYTVIVDAGNGAVREVVQQRPANLVFPQPTEAISEEDAVARLLKKFPLVLTYVRIEDRHTGEADWKLVYDLSFRKTRPQCFCGPDPLVDDTIRIDALTGEVTVNE